MNISYSMLILEKCGWVGKLNPLLYISGKDPAVVDGMLDKTLASESRGQGSNPTARPTCEAGGLTYPVIQVYGRPSSVTGAFYLPWGLDVLSNERRLAGGL